MSSFLFFIRCLPTQILFQHNTTIPSLLSFAPHVPCATIYLIEESVNNIQPHHHLAHDYFVAKSRNQVNIQSTLQ